MRIVTKVNLRGKTMLWPIGTIFDDTQSPIPADITEELRHKTGAVERLADSVPVLKEIPNVKVETKVGIAK